MNIFVLDYNPQIAARYHCDKHVIKMILESCQILSTVMHENGVRGPYRPTHKHHPCVKWAGESSYNFDWLLLLMTELCSEYTLRYKGTHKCEQYMPILSCPLLPNRGLTPFALAMPAKYRQADAVASYQAYYKAEKAYFATWKTAPPPWWTSGGENGY